MIQKPHQPQSRGVVMKSCHWCCCGFIPFSFQRDFDLPAGRWRGRKSVSWEQKTCYASDWTIIQNKSWDEALFSNRKKENGMVAQLSTHMLTNEANQKSPGHKSMKIVIIIIIIHFSIIMRCLLVVCTSKMWTLGVVMRVKLRPWFWLSTWG